MTLGAGGWLLKGDIQGCTKTSTSLATGTQLFIKLIHPSVIAVRHGWCALHLLVLYKRWSSMATVAGFIDLYMKGFMWMCEGEFVHIPHYIAHLLAPLRQGDDDNSWWVVAVGHAPGCYYRR